MQKNKEEIYEKSDYGDMRGNYGIEFAAALSGCRSEDTGKTHDGQQEVQAEQENDKGAEGSGRAHDDRRLSVGV